MVPMCRDGTEHHIMQYIGHNLIFILFAHLATAKKKSAKKTVGTTKVISGAAAKKAAAKTKTGVGSAPVESDVTPVG